MQKGESFDDFKSRFLQRLKQVGWFQKSSQSSSLPQTQPQKRDPRDQETIDYLANELAQAKPVS
jgi:hypothetical protein